MRILPSSAGLTPNCACVAEPQNEHTDLDGIAPRRFVHSEGLRSRRLLSPHLFHGCENHGAEVST